MLIELAVGDAYGAGFEYANEMIEPYNTVERYIQHPRHTGVYPGRYTDDAQMSIAIAELILCGKQWTPHHIADHFLRAFKRDPREGYSMRFYHFLQQTDTTEQFLNTINPASDKSGAAMRAIPIGIYPTPELVIEKCTAQAKITHDTPDGIAAACIAALMSHYFVYRRGKKAELQAFLMAHSPAHIWQYTLPKKVKAKGWMSVRAAVMAVIRNDNLKDLLQDCINFGGDVDTVATIALGAAASSHEYTQNLPEDLIMSLENGTYGRAYLMKLDENLRQYQTSLPTT